LETFNNIGAGKLEEIVLFEFLEDRGFDLDELVGHEEGDEGVRIGVYGDVQRDDLVKEGGGVDYVVD